MNRQFDIGDLSANQYFFGLAIVIGLLFGLISPDDSTLSLVQWQLQTLLPTALSLLSFTLLEKAQAFRSLNPCIKVIVSGVLGSFLFSPFALLIDIVFLGERIGSDSVVTHWLEEFSNIILPICLGWLAMNALWIFGYQLKRPLVEPAETMQNDEKPTRNYPEFFKLIPESMVDQLI